MRSFLLLFLTALPLQTTFLPPESFPPAFPSIAAWWGSQRGECSWTWSQVSLYFMETFWGSKLWWKVIKSNRSVFFWNRKWIRVSSACDDAGGRALEQGSGGALLRLLQEPGTARLHPGRAAGLRHPLCRRQQKTWGWLFFCSQPFAAASY